MDFMLEVSKLYGSTRITSNIHRAHPFFEKSVAWNITKSWSTCNTWDLDILGGEGLPRSQEIIRSHLDSNLSISSHVWPCPGHSPTSCRAHKAHRCMMYMALVVVAVAMGFAVCRNVKQLVVVSLGSTLSTTPNARLATHIETMRSITNTTIHATCCYSHTQRSPFSSGRPHIPRFLRAWLKHISLCLMEPQHILQLHVPAMSTLQEVLMDFSGLLRYLHVSNSVNPLRIKNKQHAPPRRVGNLHFFRYTWAFYNQDCLPSTNPPPKTNNALRLPEIRPYILRYMIIHIVCINI